MIDDPVPDDLLSALSASEPAERAWASLPPRHQQEYVEWVEAAKRRETRTRRIATTVERLAAAR